MVYRQIALLGKYIVSLVLHQLIMKSDVWQRSREVSQQKRSRR